MKEIIEKISSYNIVTSLVPGAVFVYLAEAKIGLSLKTNDILFNILNCYAVGIFVSRFGSVVIEPIMRKTNLINIGDYSSYLNATKSDGKIEILLEQGNMYRSLFSAIVLLLLGIMIGRISKAIGIDDEIMITFAMVGLALLFGLSYCKQYRYIERRVSESSKTPISKQG